MTKCIFKEIPIYYIWLSKSCLILIYISCATNAKYYSLYQVLCAFLTQVASSLCSLTQFLPLNMTVTRFLGHTFATLPLGESVVLKLSLPCLLYVYLFYLFFRWAENLKPTLQLFAVNKLKLYILISPSLCFCLSAWPESAVSGGHTASWFLTWCASCGVSSQWCSCRILLL